MGYPLMPVYGEALGDAVEKAKKIIAKIETNKFDNVDLVELVKINTAIVEAIVTNEE